jgi:hypothetical protein
MRKELLARKKDFGNYLPFSAAANSIAIATPFAAVHLSLSLPPFSQQIISSSVCWSLFYSILPVADLICTSFWLILLFETVLKKKYRLYTVLQIIYIYIF